MATRILTAVIWIPIIVLLFIFAPIWGIALAISIISAIGVYELLWATGFIKEKRLCVYGCVFAAVIPIWTYFSGELYLLLAATLALVSICFLDGMLHKSTVKFEMVCGVLFGAIIIPCFLSAFLRMEMSAGTRLMLALPLLYSFCSDAGGYFAGRFFGKHKLAPNLSPKKTVEGAIGAVVFAVVGGLAFGLVTQYCFEIPTNYFTLALIGIPLSITAQFGDLVFSYIKRQFDIKDYGKLFVGHGGVLDRFDSVMFVAPALELLLHAVRIF